MEGKRKLSLGRAFPYVAIAPAIILILLFKLYPIVLNVWSSFQWKGELSAYSYKLIFDDPTFWKSLWTTIEFNLILTPVQIVISRHGASGQPENQRRRRVSHGILSACHNFYYRSLHHVEHDA